MILEELRVGNHVLFNSKIVTVAAISETGNIYVANHKRELFLAAVTALQAMTINPDFMRNAGFQLNGDFWERDYLHIRDHEGYSAYIITDFGKQCIGSLSTVHSVQNIVFDLFREKISLTQPLSNGSATNGNNSL